MKSAEEISEKNNTIVKIINSLVHYSETHILCVRMYVCVFAWL